MSFKQLLMKGSTGDHKGRTVPEQNAPSAGRVPASERRGTARNLAVLYLGDARETRLMGGAFSYEHPHLALDLSANLHEASARISEPGRYDALVIGWSIPESEAAALITHIRAKGFPISVVAIGEQSLDVLRQAGADQCVQKGGSLLAKLPVAIEEAVNKRTTGSDPAPGPAATTVQPPRDNANDPAAQIATLTQEVAALRTKESRLRALVDKLPACVVRLSPDGLVLATNAVALSLLGASQPNQLLRKPFDALLDEEARGTWKDFVTRVCSGEQRSCEVTITALDGVSRAIEADGVPSPGEGQNNSSALMVLRDVSDRKRLESALEDAIKRAPALDADPQPSIEVAVTIPQPPQTSDAAPLPDARILRDLEADLHHLAGRARSTFDEIGTLLRNAASEHDAAFTRQVDAYARVKAEQLEHWRSYESFVEHATSGIVRVSPTHRLQAANPAFAAVLGYDSPEELVAAAPAIGAITDESRWHSAVEQWRAGSTDAIETPWRRKDGGLTTMRLRGRLVTHPGGTDEYIEVVAEDLGVQRALEAQLRRARRWEDAARVTSGIAADLTYVVASIKEAADRLHASQHSGDAGQHADAIGQGVARALALSRQLVAFGRKEARDPKAFDLNDAIHGLEGVVRRLVDEHVEMRFELASSLAAVEASQPALEEAIVHLTVAAAGALPAGGAIEFSTASRDITGSPADRSAGLEPGRYATVSVAASGWGLDADVRQRLAAGGDVAGDVGKGLVTARRCVSQMGGRVVVDGVPDASLIFTVYLPLTRGVETFEPEDFSHEVNVISPSTESASGTQRVEM
jgi:PAS domain S-box-containing protein